MINSRRCHTFCWHTKKLPQVWIKYKINVLIYDILDAVDGEQTTPNTPPSKPIPTTLVCKNTHPIQFHQKRGQRCIGSYILQRAELHNGQ